MGRSRILIAWTVVAQLAFIVACGGRPQIGSDPSHAPNTPPGTPGVDDRESTDGGMPAPDAGITERVDAGITPSHPCAPTQSATRLSELCLYEDLAARRVRTDVLEFAPTYGLWTDGAHKRRWMRLPAGAQIDTRDMDHWQFPVGTQVFKEFSLDGKLLETRMIWRTGTGANDFLIATYVWTADQTDAVRNDNGVHDVLGTTHDIPTQGQCGDCHDGEPGRILGFSAAQLSRPALPNVRELSAAGALSHPPAAGQAYEVPGTPKEAAALGYLHANCGHCHNPSGPAWRDVNMDLRLRVAEQTVTETQTYRTTVGVDTQEWSSAKAKRVVPGAPADSELYYRMTLRADRRQMPGLGTEKQDGEGLQTIAQWIQGL